MQLGQLFASLPLSKELKVESKEEFFAIKPHTRRMKKSTCFSEQVNKQPLDLDTTHASLTLDLPFHSCSKELDSTFGEENALSFRRKPPKRKRNIRNPQQR